MNITKVFESKKGVITMKKMISVVLCLIFVFSLVGCGKGGKAGTEDAGYYVLISMSDESGSLDEDTLKEIGLYGAMYIQLNEDKTGVLALGDDDQMDLTWEPGVITADGEEVNYTLKDDELTMEDDGTTLVFRKEAKKE